MGRVLIGYEFSGIVREAFASLGHEAWSVDFLPTEREGNHIQGNLWEVLAKDLKWDLAIFHPPCTLLCNSGVSWYHKSVGRQILTYQSALEFKTLLEVPIPRIAVENPVMHKYAANVIGKRQDQIIQPYNFGHSASKATGLWLKNLPPLEPTIKVQPSFWVCRKDKKHHPTAAGLCLQCGERALGRYDNQTPSGQNNLTPSPDRWKERSRTYEGIARAAAEQWGKLL